MKTQLWFRVQRVDIQQEKTPTTLKVPFPKLHFGLYSSDGHFETKPYQISIKGGLDTCMIETGTNYNK